MDGGRTKPFWISMRILLAIATVSLNWASTTSLRSTDESMDDSEAETGQTSLEERHIDVDGQLNAIMSVREDDICKQGKTTGCAAACPNGKGRCPRRPLSWLIPASRKCKCVMADGSAVKLKVAWETALQQTSPYMAEYGDACTDSPHVHPCKLNCPSSTTGTCYKEICYCYPYTPENWKFTWLPLTAAKHFYAETKPLHNGQNDQFIVAPQHAGLPPNVCAGNGNAGNSELDEECEKTCKEKEYGFCADANGKRDENTNWNHCFCLDVTETGTGTAKKTETVVRKATTRTPVKRSDGSIRFNEALIARRRGKALQRVVSEDHNVSPLS